MKFIRNKLGTGFELPEPIEPTSYYVQFGRGSGKSRLQDELYKKLTEQGASVLRVNANTVKVQEKREFPNLPDAIDYLRIEAEQIARAERVWEAYQKMLNDRKGAKP